MLGSVRGENRACFQIHGLVLTVLKHADDLGEIITNTAFCLREREREREHTFIHSYFDNFPRKFQRARPTVAKKKCPRALYGFDLFFFFWRARISL